MSRSLETAQAVATWNKKPQHGYDLVHKPPTTSEINLVT